MFLSFVFDSRPTSASVRTVSPTSAPGTAWTSSSGAFATPLTLADCTFAAPMTIAGCIFGVETSVPPVDAQAPSQQSITLPITPQTSQSPSSSSGVSFVTANTAPVSQLPLFNAQTSQPLASSSPGASFNTISCGVPWIEAWSGEHLDDDSHRQLRDAGCDAKLDAALVDKLLRLYFAYFHYRLPVLSEADIHNMVTSGQAADGKSMSLALLYAILYSSSVVSSTHRLFYPTAESNC